MRKSFITLPIIAALLVAPLTANAHGQQTPRDNLVPYDSYGMKKHLFVGDPKFSQKKFHKKIHERMDRQAKRIRDGVWSKKLTWREIQSVKTQQRNIASLEQRYWNDKYFTYAERKDLMQRLDNLSRRIFRTKHNANSPGKRYYSYRYGH